MSQLTAAHQVYGGGVSFVVHPHLWSSNSFNAQSSASAGDTIVSELSAVFINCRFVGCHAASRTTRGTGVALHRLFPLVHLNFNSI
jgi:hypothetical protein